MKLEVSGIDSLIGKLQNIEANKSKLLRIIGFTLEELISSRVFNNAGTKSNSGTLIGPYSLAYYRKRQREGRSNRNVSMVETGDMQRDFQVRVVDENTVDLGFSQELSANKRRGLEDRKGPVFEPGKEEINIALEAGQEFINSLK